MSASYSINFNAQVVATAAGVTIGDVMCRDSTGGYTQITAALYAAGYYAEGISRTTSTAPNAVLDLQSHGPVDANITGLGAGVAGPISFSTTTNRLIRSSALPQVGVCDALGNALLYFGAVVSGISGDFGTNVFDIRDYGAKADSGTTDNMPAIEAAMTTLIAAKSGVIWAPPDERYPGGFYDLQTTGTAQDFLTCGTILFSGGGIFRVNDALASLPVFTFGNSLDLTIRGLSFKVHTPSTDNFTYLLKISTGQAKVENCQFIGFRGTTAVVHSYASTVDFSKCLFMGCSCPSNSGVFLSDLHYLGITFDKCEFIDTGFFNGHVYGIQGGPEAWIRINDPAQWPQLSASYSGSIRIKRCFFDEGATYSVRTKPTGSNRIDRIEIEDCQSNVGLVGVQFEGTEHASIKRSFFGFATIADTVAINMLDAGNVTLEDVHCDMVGRLADGNGANKIVADSATLSLKLRNCVYKTLASSAKVTEVITNGVRFRPVRSPADGSNTLTVYDEVVNVADLTTDRDETLPASPTTGQRHELQFNALNGHTATVKGTGKNINGLGAYPVVADSCRVLVEYNGTEWKAQTLLV